MKTTILFSLIIISLFITGCQSECPQLNIPLNHKIEPTYTMTWMEPGENPSDYSGWTVHPTNSCHKGVEKGENPTYLYCGYLSDLDSLFGPNSFMEKTLMNKDGTMGDTVHKTFVNIYDENQKFLKTVCGKSELRDRSASRA